MNMYLQKGTFPVFLEMADQFFSIITSQLANQDKLTSTKSDNDAIEHAISQTQAETNDMDGNLIR